MQKPISGGQNPPLLKSKDLKNWTLVGNFLRHDLPDVCYGEDISCGNFFPIGNKWMLLCISHPKGARYYLGDFKDEKYLPRFHAMLSFGSNQFFAPESVLTRDGRRDFLLMVPGLKDARDIALNVRHFLGKTSERPRFGRFSYIEKFDKAIAANITNLELKVTVGIGPSLRILKATESGNFLLKDIQRAFRVRVVAPMEARIERIMQRAKKNSPFTLRTIDPKQFKRDVQLIKAVYNGDEDISTIFRLKDALFAPQGGAAKDPPRR
mgnify:CR=1 FL=1